MNKDIQSQIRNPSNSSNPANLKQNSVILNKIKNEYKFSNNKLTSAIDQYNKMARTKVDLKEVTFTSSSFLEKTMKSCPKNNCNTQQSNIVVVEKRDKSKSSLTKMNITNANSTGNGNIVSKIKKINNNNANVNDISEALQDKFTLIKKKLKDLSEINNKSSLLLEYANTSKKKSITGTGSAFTSKSINNSKKKSRDTSEIFNGTTCNEGSETLYSGLNYCRKKNLTRVNSKRNNALNIETNPNSNEDDFKAGHSRFKSNLISHVGSRILTLNSENDEEVIFKQTELKAETNTELDREFEYVLKNCISKEDHYEEVKCDDDKIETNLNTDLNTDFKDNENFKDNYKNVLSITSHEFQLITSNIKNEKMNIDTQTDQNFDPNYKSNTAENIIAFNILQSYIKIIQSNYEENTKSLQKAFNNLKEENLNLKISNSLLHDKNKELNLTLLKMFHQCKVFEEIMKTDQNSNNKVQLQLLSENKYLRSICEREIAQIAYINTNKKNYNELNPQFDPDQIINKLGEDILRTKGTRHKKTATEILDGIVTMNMTMNMEKDKTKSEEEIEFPSKDKTHTLMALDQNLNSNSLLKKLNLYKSNTKLFLYHTNKSIKNSN